jgi:general secretion pathway protein N
MTRRNLLIAAGAAAFLVFVVAFLPASAAARWLAPDGARFTGVSGTLWRGSARAAEIGSLRLGETRWSLSPPALLLGRLSADVETRIGEAAASGSVSVGLSGGLTCTACRIEGNAAGLRGLFPALRSFNGQVLLELPVLELRDNWPVRAVGSARVSRVPIAMAGAPPGPATPYGDFEATLDADPVPEDGVLLVAVKDTGGPLQLTADLRVSPPGKYEFAGRARARANAPADLVNALNILGPKAADGTTELAASGSF